MAGRLLPDKDAVERYILDRVLAELKEDHAFVEVVEGDSEDVPFDWLIRLKSDRCIGLEVVRAEDQDQVRHVETELRAGQGHVNGSAEMPWDSLGRAVEQKRSRVDRYREALSNLCEDAQLHLAITSVLQELHLNDALGKRLESVASAAVGDFDVVWLVQRKEIRRLA